MIKQVYFLKLTLILAVTLIYKGGWIASGAFATEQKSELSNQSGILKLEEKIKKIEKENSALFLLKLDLEKKLALIDKQESEAATKSPAINVLRQLRKERRDTQLNLTAIQDQINKIKDYVALKDELTLLQKGEAVVQGLKEKGFLSESARIEKVINPLTVTAQAIIFIKDKTTCPLVAKVFKKVDDFVAEHKKITQGVSYAELVNELRKTCGYPLPIIVGPKGGLVVEGVGVFLLDKAEGKSLNYYLDSIDSMTEERIKNIYSKIGEQFGNLDKLMLENVGGQVLRSSDMSPSNMLYDEDHNQIYWIDTAGSKGLFLTTDVLESLPTLIIRKSIPKNNKELVETYYMELKKNLLARQNFYQSYYNKNNKVDVKSYYNSQNKGFIEDVQELNSVIKSLPLNLQPIDFERDYGLKPPVY